jgi:hypothetical protein
MLSTQTIIIIVIALFIIFLIYYYFTSEIENFTQTNPENYIITFGQKDNNQKYDITKIVNDMKTIIMSDASNNFTVTKIILTNEKKKNKEEDREIYIKFEVKKNRTKNMNVSFTQDGYMLLRDNLGSTLIDIKIYLQRLMSILNPDVSAEDTNPNYNIQVRYAKDSIVFRLNNKRVSHRQLFGLEAHAEETKAESEERHHQQRS